MKKIIFTFLFITISYSSFSQNDSDFVYVTTSVKKNKIYVLDEGSDKYGIKEFWVKMTWPLETTKNKKGKIIKSGGGYTIQFIRMNCEGKVYSTSNLVYYDRFGTPNDRPEYYNQTDEKIVPGSIMTGVYDYICQ